MGSITHPGCCRKCIPGPYKEVLRAQDTCQVLSQLGGSGALQSSGCRCNPTVSTDTTWEHAHVKQHLYSCLRCRLQKMTTKMGPEGFQHGHTSLPNRRGYIFIYIYVQMFSHKSTHIRKRRSCHLSSGKGGLRGNSLTDCPSGADNVSSYAQACKTPCDDFTSISDLLCSLLLQVPAPAPFL